MSQILPQPHVPAFAYLKELALGKAVLERSLPAVKETSEKCGNAERRNEEEQE